MVGVRETACVALALCSGLTLLSVGCRREVGPPTPPRATIEQVRVAGCREVLAGPVCEIEAATSLTLWVLTSTGEEVRVDGGSDWRTVEGGRQTVVRVSTASVSVDLFVDGRTTPTYSLPIKVWKRPAQLIEASHQRAQSPTTAIALLDDLDSTDNARLKAEVAATRARIARLLGKLDEAVAWRRKSIEYADQAGLTTTPIYALVAIAHTGIALTRNIDLARDALSQAKSRLDSTIGTEAAYVDYIEAALTRETGDFRSAIRLLRRSERRNRRLNDPLAWDAMQLRADVLALMGLHNQVSALYGKLPLSRGRSRRSVRSSAIPVEPSLGHGTRPRGRTRQCTRCGKRRHGGATSVRRPVPITAARSQSASHACAGSAARRPNCRRR